MYVSGVHGRSGVIVPPQQGMCTFNFTYICFLSAYMYYLHMVYQNLALKSHSFGIIIKTEMCRSQVRHLSVFSLKHENVSRNIIGTRSWVCSREAVDMLLLLPSMTWSPTQVYFKTARYLQVTAPTFLLLYIRMQGPIKLLFFSFTPITYVQINYIYF